MKATLLTNKFNPGFENSVAINVYNALLTAGINCEIPVFPEDIPTMSKPFFCPNNRLPRIGFNQNHLKNREVTEYHSLKNRSTDKYTETDIILISSLDHSFMNKNSLKRLFSLKKPVVWYVHDFWPFSGGCLTNINCTKYTEKCGNCYLLNSGWNNDQSRSGWRKKNSAYKTIELNLVASNHLLAEKAANSSLMKQFNSRVIPIPVDTNIYKPIYAAREILNLDESKFYILYGGENVNSDPVQGFKYFVAALDFICCDEQIERESVEILFFGNSGRIPYNRIPFKCIHAGILNDDITRALYFSAANIYVSSALAEPRNNNIAEVMACKTAISAFPAGMAAELIEHQQNSFISPDCRPEELAEGIKWIYLLNKEQALATGNKAREKVISQCSLQVCGEKFEKYFSGILEK